MITVSDDDGEQLFEDQHANFIFEHSVYVNEEEGTFSASSYELKWASSFQSKIDCDDNIEESAQDFGGPLMGTFAMDASVTFMF